MKKLVLLMIVILGSVVYPLDDEMTVYEVPSNLVPPDVKIHPQRENEIWIADGCIGIYDREKGYFIGAVNELPTTNVREFCFDNLINCWIATQKGLARYHEKDSSTEIFPVGEGYLPDDNIFCLKFDPANSRMIIGTGNGLVIFKGDLNAVPYNPAPNDWEVYLGDSNWSIHDVEIDNNGNIWAIESYIKKAVFRQDGADWIEYNSTNSIIEDPYRVTVDKDGNIWVDCDGFLAKWNGSSWEKLEDIIAGDIEIDKDNILWAIESDYLVKVDLNSAPPVVIKFDNNDYDWLTTGAYESLSLNNNGNLLIGCIDYIVEHEKPIGIVFEPSNSQFSQILLRPNCFKVLIPGNYQIDLFSVSGRNIWKASGYYPVGTYPFSSKKIASGNYFINISTKTDAMTKKITIAK